MATGELSILNVGTGDTKLTFDKSNPAECIRAARIVTDMLRRGYALLVEIERNGVKGFQRVKRFDEKKCEYIIADFDPVVAEEEDRNEAGHEEEQETQAAETPKTGPKRVPKLKPVDRAIKASSAKAVGVPRRAGG